MQTQRVTLTYAISDQEDMQLDFELDPEQQAWHCEITLDEMNRILKTAYDQGKLDQ